MYENKYNLAKTCTKQYCRKIPYLRRLAVPKIHNPGKLYNFFIGAKLDQNH